MNVQWQKFHQTLTKELGDDLAQEFVQSLYTKSSGSVEIATRFFYDLGRMWAPLMCAWGKWVEQHAEGTIAIVLRDAKPLSVLPVAENWKQLYLNRVTCGVPDEISGDISLKQHPLLKQYLQQHNCSDYFTFVDSGCYGSVVLELYKLGIHFQPLFFFSKNPNIRGFVNELGISMKEGEILNDSLECGFPHMTTRPSNLIDVRGRITVDLHASDTLSIMFGNAAMRGVREARIDNGISAKAAAEILLVLSQKAQQGEFTGILGSTSPEWSKKNEFLENWPKDLCWM